jgi:hypothetical protein
MLTTEGGGKRAAGFRGELRTWRNTWEVRPESSNFTHFHWTLLILTYTECEFLLSTWKPPPRSPPGV